MSSIDVREDALRRIQASLRRGAEAVDGVATSAPGAVNAGVLSPLVTSVLARLTASAAAVSEGLRAAADGVASNAEAYWGVDDSVRRDFEVGR